MVFGVSWCGERGSEYGGSMKGKERPLLRGKASNEDAVVVGRRRRGGWASPLGLPPPPVGYCRWNAERGRDGGEQGGRGVLEKVGEGMAMGDAAATTPTVEEEDDPPPLAPSYG